MKTLCSLKDTFKKVKRPVTDETSRHTKRILISTIYKLLGIDIERQTPKFRNKLKFSTDILQREYLNSHQQMKKSIISLIIIKSKQTTVRLPHNEQNNQN